MSHTTIFLTKRSPNGEYETEKIMNRKELEQMEKYWVKYHRALPDYPISDKAKKIDQFLTYAMAFLLGVMVVLASWLFIEIARLGS